jgi:hypothetical protein
MDYTWGTAARPRTPYVASDSPGLSIAGMALASQMKIHMSLEWRALFSLMSLQRGG